MTATITSRMRDYQEPTACRCLGVDHLVVDVVGERVGNGEEQSVCRRKSSSKTTRSHEARDHIGHARDLRSGEHDHVIVDCQRTMGKQARGVAGSLGRSMDGRGEDVGSDSGRICLHGFKHHGLDRIGKRRPGSKQGILASALDEAATLATSNAPAARAAFTAPMPPPRPFSVMP